MKTIRVMVAMLVAVLVCAVILSAGGRASAQTQVAFAWGSNADGQLADGSLTAPDSCDDGGCATVPQSIPTDMDVTQAYGGSDFELAVQAGGTVLAWGGNENGQLGMGNQGATPLDTPTLIPGLSDVVQVAASRQSAVAVNSDGTVDWWGNANGGNQDSPVQESDITNATAVAAGDDFDLALLSDGTVDGWGYNGFGGIGSGWPVACGNSSLCATTTSPIVVNGLSDISAISASGDQAMALTTDGTVETWGQNNLGALGNGTVTGPDACENAQMTCDLTPTAVSGLPTIAAISAGNAYDLALDTSGNIWAWGATCATSCQSEGVLGDGTDSGSSTPVELTGLPAITTIVAGQSFSIALDGSGDVYTWGDNASGQLGLGTTTGPTTCASVPCAMSPTQVSGLSGIAVVAADAAGSSGAALAATAAPHTPPTTTTTSTTTTVTIPPPPHCTFFGHTIPCPTITSFSPPKGPVGTTVTITGTNLELGATVIFGGDAYATATGSTGGTTATVVVPAGAKTGVLTLEQGDAHSAKKFKVKKK